MTVVRYRQIVCFRCDVEEKPTVIWPQAERRVEEWQIWGHWRVIFFTELVILLAHQLETDWLSLSFCCLVNLRLTHQHFYDKLSWRVMLSSAEKVPGTKCSCFELVLVASCQLTVLKIKQQILTIHVTLVWATFLFTFALNIWNQEASRAFPGISCAVDTNEKLSLFIILHSKLAFQPTDEPDHESVQFNLKWDKIK